MSCSSSQVAIILAASPMLFQPTISALPFLPPPPHCNRHAPHEQVTSGIVARAQAVGYTKPAGAHSKNTQETPCHGLALRTLSLAPSPPVILKIKSAISLT
ncbi:hypothetical protein EJ06DRAFT_329464 [Trichodelitschia bisporula]|uniref:Uncharacterized protein n=1 Tax=Trichodelitschia bisporula TaxID=703511 RepID=A0A6G1I201_9PEZI|nr:hypothetical protein EJ06DRAFT_329464 [Trichodelitschia bisporula]